MKPTNRRNFLRQSAIATAGLAIIPTATSCAQPPKGLYMVGPMDGYSPHIGTMLSMMNMMRAWVVRQVEDLTVEQLDFQLDDDSNSIGAMLLHLAATEKYYQLNTFEGMEWGSWSQEIKDEWETPMSLGEDGRKKIKGNEIGFYLKKLEDVRNMTKQEFAKRDDDWIMESESFFGNEPTNNYCKWFHVCEHESNHNGQIKLIKKRLGI